jgi:ubiquinone/menaquinone biosynthesis C-methylase UbiE
MDWEGAAMVDPSHDGLVIRQFGPRAHDYVASTVHARGHDLDAIAAIASARRPARALDLGCGGGHVSFAISPHAREVVAVDISDDMLAAVSEEAGRRGLQGVTTRRAGVEALPFADASFDLVASRFSAHHWQDLAAGLREARRVLGAQGVAVFADVYSPGRGILDTHLQAVELLRDPSHFRNRTLAEWVGMVSEAGFRPIEITTSKLRLDFESWIRRMATAPAHVAAIRSLQQGASEPIRRRFGVEADGSFTLDTMLMVADPD